MVHSEAMNSHDAPYFTPAETASLLRVSRSAIYRAIRLGRLPALRLTRLLLIPREALRPETLGAMRGKKERP